MKTAHPASLPPALRASGGMSRSTAASIVAASSALKNSHGPGRHGAGGFARLGLHGMGPLAMRACADTELATMQAAEASNRRRERRCDVMYVLAVARRALQRERNGLSASCRCCYRRR